jgi:hypothetical protein
MLGLTEAWPGEPSRRLTSQGKLLRSGQGGRGNPFSYRCTDLGLATLRRIMAASTPNQGPEDPPNAEQRAAAVAMPAASADAAAELGQELQPSGMEGGEAADGLADAVDALGADDGADEE